MNMIPVGEATLLEVLLDVVAVLFAVAVLIVLVMFVAVVAVAKVGAVEFTVEFVWAFADAADWWVKHPYETERE